MWQAVAMLLAETLAKQLAAKAADSIIAEVFGKESTVFDAIQSSLIAVQTIVRQSIQDNSLREAKADLDSLQIIYREYSHAPSADRLGPLTIDTVKSVSALQSLGLPAIAGFSIAATLHMAVLSERWQKTKDDGEKRNILEAIDGCDAHVASSIEQIKQNHNVRFGPLEQIVVSHHFGGHDGDTVSEFSWQYRFDHERRHAGRSWGRGFGGAVIGPPLPFNEAAQIKTEHMMREWKPIEEGLVTPLEQSRAKWQQLRQVVVSL